MTGGMTMPPGIAGDGGRISLPADLRYALQHMAAAKCGAMILPCRVVWLPGEK
jgi:hypothetical protein